MFDWFKKKKPVKAQEAPPVVKIKTPKEEPVKKTEKELATEKGEPYVAILKMDIDSANLHQGSFELDWNEIFISRLVKAGYMIKKDDADADIVDRWFQNVCRHVVMETWEQEQAIAKSMSGQFINQRDIGGGRSEVS